MTSETWEKHPSIPISNLMRRPCRLGPVVILATWVFLYFHVIAQLFDGISQFFETWHTPLVIRSSNKEPASQHVDGEVPFGSLAYFILCGIAGIVSCGITHTSIVPLDLTKCRMQVYPEKYYGIFAGFRKTIEEEGFSGLTKGWASTAIGYSLQGLGKFGFYEVFKVFYSSFLGQELAYLWRTSVYLAASASAEFLADIMLAPMEAVKVRMQTSANAPPTLRGCVAMIWRTEGLNGFYKGLVPLWLRQIPYTMMKFACFERTIELLYIFVVPKPRWECTKEEQLVVTFAAGYIAGIFCAVISHPADTVISKLNQDSGSSVPDVVKNVGFSGLWKGLFPRILMIGTLTALQWFIYDSVKVILKLPRASHLGPPEVMQKKIFPVKL